MSQKFANFRKFLGGFSAIFWPPLQLLLGSINEIETKLLCASAFYQLGGTLGAGGGEAVTRSWLEIENHRKLLFSFI